MKKPILILVCVMILAGIFAINSAWDTTPAEAQVPQTQPVEQVTNDSPKTVEVEKAVYHSCCQITVPDVQKEK